MSDIRLESTSEMMGVKNSVFIVSKGKPSNQDTTEVLQSLLLFLELSGHMDNIKEAANASEHISRFYEQIKPYIKDENNGE